MKFTTIIAAFFTSYFAFSQSQTENYYDRWSIEIAIGQNKPIRPFSQGYYSSNSDRYFNFGDVLHYEAGVRYMFNTKFGFKLDAAFDRIVNQSSNGSLDFNSHQYRLGFQGVVNMARVLDFETFSSRFGLLAHAGIQVSMFTPKTGPNKDVTEDNGGVIFGITPQLRINDWLVVHGDFSVINNVRQHFNWDGSYSAQDNNLSGSMYNASVGLTLYLGTKDKHADWYFDADNLFDIKSEDKLARKRLDDIESMLSDVDKDGVADYLDSENNTPNGVAVDSRGKYIDTNRNGVPDELERKMNDGKDGLNTNVISKEDAIISLIKNGFVNVFYDVNEDYPNNGSTNNVYYIIQFLRKYPDAKVKLVGYADIRGNERKNKDLSLRRAKNLYSVIIASGIDPSRVSISGNGLDKSYPTDSKIGLDLARRVNIILE